MMELALSFERVPKELFAGFAAVGLIRGEYNCRRHDNYITVPECQEALRKYLDDVCSKMDGRPVWYRTIELEASEANVLRGVDHIIDGDRNPILSLRGIRRAVRYPEAFRMELEVIAEVAGSHSNLNILFPFVHSIEEIQFGRRELEKVKFKNKFGMMAEIPSAILCLPEFLREGVMRVVLGMNDLTSLTLGVPRASVRDNCAHEAIVRLIEEARTATLRDGVELVAAGYFPKGFISIAKQLGLDAVVLHYAMLDEYLGER